jgi:isoleucyl-tRNA synthetase
MEKNQGKNTKSEAAKREERILEFWRENKIFEKSLEQTRGKREFIFYDGPVTSNSEPVLHTMEPFSFKDVIPRFKTMRGFHVRRKGGWDTHGLPVELQIEKKLKFTSKNDIENYGIAAFNKLCRDSVWEYIGLWKDFTNRIGYWADQENSYVTYHNDYIESVWNIVQKINEQNLLYKDYKVVPWCPRCGTALSSHELAQGYEDVKDLSVTVKFEIKEQKNTYILAWTTTPWTLPGNVALAVGKDIEYVKIEKGNEFLILAKERLGIINGEYKIIEELKGKDLIGLEYEPLYPFLADNISAGEKPKMKKAYRIYPADFVTTEDGTGVVHTAVMYGQDDFELGAKIGLPKHHLLGLDGKFLPGTDWLAGRSVVDENLAVDILKDLHEKGLLLEKEKYSHSYPFCWRCKTRLIYYARDSWYIRVSDPKIKKQLISENEKINWEPAHIRDGRFGEWLREIKDWAVSRERYWGTPLPVWICEVCKKIDVIGGIQDLKDKTRKSGNKYFVMRHGEAENNVEGDIHHRNLEYSAKLTKRGKKEILESCKNLKEKMDIIISSPLERAKETAQIICEQINFPPEKVIYDKRVREQETSFFFDGKDKATFNKYYDEDYLDNPNEVLLGGESFAQVIKRVGQFIYELETKYSDKNILIVGHGNATDALSFVVRGLLLNTLSSKNDPFASLQNAEIRKLDFVPLPHNENYELDLHRPYIDEMNLACSCGGNLIRTKEVMDVWFDSGAMPFAQDHYPFENKKWVDGPGYPADFIAEAVDQTRGWFYTLHAIGILMGRGKAYKNVICLGHLLDAVGKKMSKSLGNVVDPWEAMDKYGADTLRLWMYEVNQPGESKNFDEKTVALLHQQVFGLLYNVLAFYELYPIPEQARYGASRDKLKSENVLDQWILARLDELIKITTRNLDNYRLLEPTRAIKDFIGDLSTWYLRRSRERIKNEASNPEVEQAHYGARATLYFVLKTLAKVLAPLAPFSAEDIWLRLRNKEDAESVHLVDWPHLTPWPLSLIKRGVGERSHVIKNMQMVRNIVTLGLEARQKAGIKVRQPLQKLKVKSGKLSSEYIDLIKDELNVKEIAFDNSIASGVELDVEITPELKQEGDYRELIRTLQDRRKKMGLTPNDIVALHFETNDAGKKLIQEFETDLKKTVLVSKIEFIPRGTLGIGVEEIKIDNLVFKVKIDKI